LLNYEHAIIMDGGSGTRLRPLTTVMNKHFLPVYDKPMVYYALANLLHVSIEIYLLIIRYQQKYFTKPMQNFPMGSK